MYITNCIRKKNTIIFFILSLLLPLHIHTHETDMPEEMIQNDDLTPEQIEIIAQQQQIIVAHLDRIKTAEETVLRSIDTILTNLLLAIDNNTVRIKHKDAFVSNAIMIRGLIRDIDQNKPTIVDISSIHFLSFFNNSLLKHLLSDFKKSVSQIRPFDVDQFSKRYTPVTDTPDLIDNLEKGIATNQKLLNRLQIIEINAGLKWYNKKYRTFNNYVLSPIAKYNLHGRALIASAIGCFALLTRFHATQYNQEDRICYNNSDEYLKRKENNTLSFFRNTVGYPPEINMQGLENRYQLKALGNVEVWLRQWNMGHMPISTILLPFLAPNIRSEMTKAKEWVKIKTSQFHNFMLGGLYANKQINSEFNRIRPRYRFKDLIGLDLQKHTLSNIVDYLENPERVDSKKITPYKGYIFTGPPRTGKSCMAEAIAGEIEDMFVRLGRSKDDFNFFPLPAEAVLIAGINEIIQEAKELAPCILFIDEIDLLGLQRVGGNPQLLAQFLESMSGCMQSDPDKVVIIMAATNSPETLEKALRQPGRLSKEIRFDYPNIRERKEFLIKKLSASNDVSQFNLDKLSFETEGKSFEALNIIINSAAYRALLRNEPLTQEHLEQSLNEEIRNIIFTDDSHWSDAERRLVATHQAGRALALHLLKPSTRLAKVTTRPFLTDLTEIPAWDQYHNNSKQINEKKIQHGKIFTYHMHDTHGINGYNERIKQCKIALAGDAAETIILGKAGYDYDKEYPKQALSITESIAFEGIPSDMLTLDLRTEYQRKALALRDECKQEIYHLLTEYKDVLHILIEELMVKKELHENDIAAIVNGTYHIEQDHDTIDSETIEREMGIKEFTPTEQ